MSKQDDVVPPNTPLTTARVESGVLAGVAGADAAVTVFKGIPYAAPPAGDLRWRPPEPPRPWEGVRQADTFGPICPQYVPPPGSFYGDEFYLEEQPQSEDCLYLNVWTAAETAAERRPVMVWFHGGGFIEGSGSLPSFHGETLARKGVVLVTVNYRLGVFGFFAHPELTAESEQGVSGNYALLDQVAALRWVRDNIAAFGGDAGNVTIFGQSAGAMSMFLLLVSPLSQGLFHKAIGQSGSAFSFLSTSATLREVEGRGLQLAESWGASSPGELRALPVQALIGPDLETYRAGGHRPNVDGWAIPEDPIRMVVEGRVPSVPLMLGGTSDEWSPMGAMVPVRIDDYRRQSAQRFGERAPEFFELYPAAADQEARLAQVASMSDQLFAGMRVWAGIHAWRSPQTYLYYFDRKLPGRNSAFYGAFHSSDLYYVFDTLDSTDRPWEPADRRLADTMTSYWASFAAAGDPNGAGLAGWPAFDERDDQVMELGERIGPMPTPKRANIAFFEREIALWLDREVGRAQPR